MARVINPTGYRVARAVLKRPLLVAYEISVDGFPIPDGPAILAANHRSFMDSLFVALVVDRPVCFLSKAEYFDRRLTAWMFRATGQLPVRRGSPAGARAAFEAAKEVLSAGGIVGVYPEGTRSRDGQLHRGHLGPARLALAAGAPIIPVGLVGTEQVQPPGAALPRLGKKVEVRFGRPRWIDSGEDRPSPALRSFTALVMSDIAELCGQAHGERFQLAGA